MTVWTGKEANDRFKKLRYGEPVDGYYDYSDNENGAIIRLKDKECIFFNACPQGTIVIQGSLNEFKALYGLNKSELEVMIEWAKQL